MNEQIKALLLNARNMFDNGVTESNNKIYIHGSEENLEKFAELIVQACIGIAHDYETELSNTKGLAQGARGAGMVAYKISRHFGVEE